MEKVINGWVVVNHCHPSRGKTMLCNDTFAETRTASIKLFIANTNCDWRWWKRNFNFQCERAVQSITLK